MKGSISSRAFFFLYWHRDCRNQSREGRGDLETLACLASA
jgi:hypothetical protein